MRLNERQVLQIARRLLSAPTAPYHEESVRDEILSICREHKLRVRRDRFGNLLVRSGRKSSGRPILFAAHMDHPGFEVVKFSGRRGMIEFRGGVGPGYFRRGLKVRLFPGSIPVTLGAPQRHSRRFEFELREPPASRPRFAMWDLTPFAIRGGRLHSRGCDDVAGVAMALAALIEVKDEAVNAMALLSRAEEVGFQGALLAADAGSIPKSALVISLETSKEIPPVQMGSGVIIRVGDRTSIFDSRATRFLTEVARGLAEKDRSFAFQKALMSGGTCEATAYQEYGYQTGAICVALGNYHNCAPSNRIAEEFISRSDVMSMVRLLAESARRMPQFDKLVSRLNRDLSKLLKQARRRMG